MVGASFQGLSIGLFSTHRKEGSARSILRSLAAREAAGLPGGRAAEESGGRGQAGAAEAAGHAAAGAGHLPGHQQQEGGLDRHAGPGLTSPTSPGKAPEAAGPLKEGFSRLFKRKQSANSAANLTQAYG